MPACWRAWSGAAFRSIAACSRGCRTSSARSRPNSKRRSTRSPARRSMRAAQAARRHPVRPDGPARAAPRPRPDNGRPARARSKNWPSRATSCRRRSWTGGRCRSCARPIPRRCRITSIPRRIACTRPTRSRRRSTGRLSSSEPNLQNIPIRTEDGRKIRKAFIAAPGMKLVSADYSQIELRLLAEVAEVPSAAQGVPGRRRHPRDDRVGNVRRAGEGHAGRRAPPRQGDQLRHHLRHLGLRPRQPARHRARARRATTSRNISSASPASATTWTRRKNFCREHGYVLTLFGRKCHYPDIKASNPSIRAFNERAAINARLQGSAADIIRRAMVRIEPALTRSEAQRADAACRCTTN